MNEEQKRQLIKTIEESEAWERICTNVDGLYVVKPPENNNRQLIFVEVVPSINGYATKKRGLYLKSIDDLEAYQKLLENPKTRELITVISEYYGMKKTPKIEI